MWLDLRYSYKCFKNRIDGCRKTSYFLLGWHFFSYNLLGSKDSFIDLPLQDPPNLRSKHLSLEMYPKPKTYPFLIFPTHQNIPWTKSSLHLSESRYRGCFNGNPKEEGPIPNGLGVPPRGVNGFLFGIRTVSQRNDLKENPWKIYIWRISGFLV